MNISWKLFGLALLGTNIIIFSLSSTFEKCRYEYNVKMRMRMNGLTIEFIIRIDAYQQ